jgi:lipopolysaccharide biosynthesis glycosyltransferase
MFPTIVFTVCTGNYLAQAKAMADSVIKYNKSYSVFIGVVDKLNGRIDTASFQPHQLIEAENLNLPDFERMKERYNLLELSCALKSFYISHLLKKYKPEKIIYLDTDILVFHSFEFIEQRLDEYSLLLTPHISVPFPLDGKRPQEKEMLKNGIYNAGFFALKNDKNAVAFLEWWKKRMVDQCYNRPKEGLFTDQKWFNLVPLFFNLVYIITHPGYNVAYWNLHERTVDEVDGCFKVNKEYDLIFFHYSGSSIDSPHEISRHQDRFTLETLPVIRKLFTLYQDQLLINGHKNLLELKCYYEQPSAIKKIFRKMRRIK